MRPNQLQHVLSITEMRKTLINNRGPILFDNDGSSLSIRNAYSKYGFYIFEDVLSKEELKDIKIKKKLKIFYQQVIVLYLINGLNLIWSKPLGDPWST